MDEQIFAEDGYTEIKFQGQWFYRKYPKFVTAFESREAYDKWLELATAKDPVGNGIWPITFKMDDGLYIRGNAISHHAITNVDGRTRLWICLDECFIVRR